MSKVHQKKKISQKSKELYFINQMKISKEVKQELIRSTKKQREWIKQSYEQEKGFEEEITILHSQTCLTRES